MCSCRPADQELLADLRELATVRSSVAAGAQSEAIDMAADSRDRHEAVLSRGRRSRPASCSTSAVAADDETLVEAELAMRCSRSSRRPLTRRSRRGGSTATACAAKPSASRGAARRADAARLAASQRTASPLHEVEHAQPRGKAGAAPGRQDMVGAGDVIADRLRRMAPRKIAPALRTAPPAPRRRRPRARDARRDAVDQRHRLVQPRTRMMGRAPPVSRRCGARQVGEMALTAAATASAKPASSAMRWPAPLVVLRLREQSARSRPGRSTCRRHQDLGRAGDHVDPDHAETRRLAPRHRRCLPDDLSTGAIVAVP